MHTDGANKRRVLAEEADRHLLAAYAARLRGKPGKQVRILMPKTLKEAIQLAVTSDSLDRKEQGNNGGPAGTISSNVFSIEISCYSCGMRGHVTRDCRSKPKQNKRIKNNMEAGRQTPIGRGKYHLVAGR